MSIEELITLLRNRLSFAQTRRTEAFQRGDIETVATIDADIAATNSTLAVLESAVLP
jgi:hypothetical protein